ncbi:hypothetical protein G7Y89_g1255 [Cudoniella acicularis]|uniref:Post-SET domain-containing protein n=1 Tax=Cudoniella acicularis TaxID=354080 RepID=A0A8H4W9Q5_9HELO|nr:hypothetical protein G7Y89_g1255 [Cudoniella acicularis]
MAYPPLDLAQDEIRLLSLVVDDDSNKSIQCTTTITKLANAPPFKALSYFRGDRFDRRSVMLNGERLMVPKNLDAALRALYRHEQNAIWVDVLCINQDDGVEKSHQVGLMSEIYGCAAEVLAWLGAPIGSQRWTNGALIFIQLWAQLDWKLDNKADVQQMLSQKPFWLRQSWQQAQDFLLLPFWKRRWILQELVLARKAFLLCGGKKVAMGDVEKVMETWKRLQEPSFAFEIKQYIQWVQPVATGRLQLYSKLRASRLKHGTSPTLATLLEVCQAMDVSDPRDQVYALLGMAEKCDIVIDYTKSAKDALTDIAAQMIKSSKHLDILRDAGVVDLKPVERFDLPSWVPTWERPPCLPLPKTFDSSSNYDAIYHFDEDELLGEQNRARLFANGIKCGNIIEVDSAEVMIENPAQILGQHFVRYKLHQKYPTGIPVLQAIFRTMLLDNNFTSSERLTADDNKFFDLAAGFLFMLQLMDQVKNESLFELAMTYDVSVDNDEELPDYAESFLKYTDQTSNNRAVQDILELFLGTSELPSQLQWPKELDLKRGQANLRPFLAEAANCLDSRLSFFEYLIAGRSVLFREIIYSRKKYFAMSAETLNRAALGQVALLGMLYDARSDQFLPHSALNGALPDEAVNRSNVRPKHQTLISNDSYKDKFEKMGVTSELGASFLAGLVNVEGAGRYLQTPDRGTALTAHRALHYTISTVQESINLAGGNFKDFLSTDQLLSTVSATHFVSGVTWGASCIVSATRTIPSENDRPGVEKALESAFEAFEWTDEWGFDGASTYPPQLKEEFGDIMVYSDILDHNEYLLNDLDAAHTLFVNLPKLVEESTDPKGTPLSYTLLPIGFLSMFFGVSIPSTVSQGHISAEYQEKYVGLLDDHRVAQGSLNDYYQQLKDHTLCVRPMDVFRVSDRVRAAEKAETELRSTYTRLVKDIRAGKASSQDLSKMIETFTQGNSSPKALTAITKEFSERLSFVDFIEGKGAKYIGYDGACRQEFEKCSRKKSWGDSYIFYFNDDSMKDAQAWKEHLDLLTDILDKMTEKERMFVVDCNATGTPFKELCVVQYQEEELVSTNVLKQRRHLADKCILRYDPRYLDETMKDDPWPPKRKMVKIPCPGAGPSCKMNHEWICYKCHSPVEFGTMTEYMYCECGRVRCRGLLYGFDCQKPGHTPKYAKYEDYQLLSVMKALVPPPEVNILILGETGVGKSTFVNAFINYLTFSSLDHALSASQLNWVIPCSFASSAVDQDTGKLMQRVVQIGSSEADEVSGVKGKSATQKATAYPIYIGGKLIRLIDTPGIGDVRGIEQDKLNMVHTLSVLRNYDTLHGIMILLKPNNARLTLMFKFCINELLTHLHRDAAKNMIYGFTNTRGSMYTPGDAVGPLETQLSNYQGVLPGLYENTVYCFDSESFRYLAARKQPDELDLGNLDDYRRSWEHSATESQRLMDYFEKRNPHLVKSTLELAETRDLIARLVQPMAEIIKVVTKTIADSKKAMDDLSNTQKSGTALKGLLNLTKTTLVTKQLDRPYTVCDNTACVSRVANSGGGGSVVLRKSLCHDPCSLTEIKRDERGAAGISGCYAFREDGKCRKCSHPPADHMHVMVLYSEATETSIDPIVQQKLNANASEFQVKDAQVNALKQRIAEYQTEKDLLEEAQAKFSHYLEQNSITVREGENGPQVGSSRYQRADLIDALEISKKKHLDFVNAMRKGKQVQFGSKYQALDEKGVHRLVTSLCAMKHYGQQLKQAEAAVKNAYAAQFNERPYRIRRPEAFMFGSSGHSSWKKKSSSSWGKPVKSMLYDFGGASNTKRNSEMPPTLPPLTQPMNGSSSRASMPPPGNSSGSKKNYLDSDEKSSYDGSGISAPPPYDFPANGTTISGIGGQSANRRLSLKNFIKAKVFRRNP